MTAVFYPVSRISGRTYAVRDLQLSCEAGSMEEALEIFSEKAEGHIDSAFINKNLPVPAPSEPREGDAILAFPLTEEARILLWNTVKEKHLTAEGLADKMGVSREKAEHILYGTRAADIGTYYAAFKAVGYYLSLELNPYK
jgi:hypothetical protein